MLDRKSQHHIRGNELDSQFIQQGLQFIVCVSEGGPSETRPSDGYPLLQNERKGPLSLTLIILQHSPYHLNINHRPEKQLSQNFA